MLPSAIRHDLTITWQEAAGPATGWGFWAARAGMVTAGGDTLGPFTFSLFHFLARIFLLSKLGLTFSTVSPREVTPSLGHSQA